MDSRKWFDGSQPQTLQSAVILSYLNAAFGVLYAIIGFNSGSYIMPLLLGAAAGAFGIANEKRWGYILCLACSILYLAFWLLIVVTLGVSFNIVLNLLFAILLVVLLLHPQSREYQRIWFK